MSLHMLRRLKTAKPRWRILIGLWVLVELLSLPAAASVALSIAGRSAPLMVEPIETNEPGIAQFLVTHSVPFDILVSDMKSEVNVIVEDAKYDRPALTACANLQTTHPRLIKTLDAPKEADTPIANIFVTVTFDPKESPDISFDQISFVPPATPCQLG